MRLSVLATAVVFGMAQTGLLLGLLTSPEDGDFFKTLVLNQIGRLEHDEVKRSGNLLLNRADTSSGFLAGGSTRIPKVQQIIEDRLRAGPPTLMRPSSVLLPKTAPSLIVRVWASSSLAAAGESCLVKPLDQC